MSNETMNHLLHEAPLPSEHPLAQRLRTAFDQLSPGQQRVARLLLESPYDVAFLPVADVGRRANVSDSTVVRLAAELGYSGYPELRQELQGGLLARMAPIELLDQRLRTDGHDPSAIIELEIQNLKIVQESLTSEVVDSAIQRLQSAEQVFVLGMRSGFGVAHSCWHLLQQVLGQKVELVTLLGGSLADQLAHINRGDALIIFTTPRYSRQILQVARYAQRRGADVIAITDRLLSPAGRIAWLTIPAPVRSASFFPSSVAAQVVVNVIVSELARRQHDAATDRLGRVEDVANEFNLFLEDGNNNQP
jgi:DNA-binding MurR/RpiR family transcriptional regulator